ncbi:MAG: hypothetical protein ACREOQ_08525 [Gemmatimonadales bacterium]
MPRLTLSTRRVSWALAFALGLVLSGCGGGGDTTAPTPGPEPIPTPLPGPEPAPQPGPQPAPQPQPAPAPALAGTYALIQINNSQPGQLVTIANPDGIVVGLYRFDAAMQLTVDEQQHFTLTVRYSDDKSQLGYDDEGEITPAGETGGSVALAFGSATYGDSFSGIYTDGVIAFTYDFDGDGRPDTTFAFQRVG